MLLLHDYLKPVGFRGVSRLVTTSHESGHDHQSRVRATYIRSLINVWLCLWVIVPVHICRLSVVMDAHLRSSLHCNLSLLPPTQYHLYYRIFREWFSSVGLIDCSQDDLWGPLTLRVTRIRTMLMENLWLASLSPDQECLLRPFSPM